MNATRQTREAILSIVEVYPAAIGASAIAAPKEASEQDLVARMATGDQSALRELMRRNRARVHRFVLRMLHDSDRIEEVVNDTFMAAWRQAGKFERRSSVATWLLAIARNRALSARNEGRRREEALDDEHAATLVDERATPDVIIEQRDGAAVLRRLTARLPANQARLIDLIYYRGKSVREVAQMVGIPDNTVKSRTFLARRRLAALLAAEGIRCG